MTNDTNWPKRYANYDEIPDEYHDDPKVREYEETTEDGEIISVLQHDDHSPDAWIRVHGVGRGELADHEKYNANEGIMQALRDHPGLIVSWYTDEEIEIVTEE